MRIVSAVGNGIRNVAMAAANTTVTITRSVGMTFARGARWGSQVIWSRSKIDYARNVGDASRNSAVVAVIGWIARNFPEAPVRVARLKPDGTREYVVPGATGPGFMLRLLERPNPYYSGVLLWMATIVDWFSDGNGYWYKERYPASAGPLLEGRVVRLWWLPARYMTPRGDETTFLTHYEYNPNGTILKLDPNDVVHFRDSMDPENPRRGRAPLQSLLREIYTDDEAGNFTAQLLTNLGVPGVVLAPSNTNTGGVRSDPNAVKQAFMDKFGGDKRGEPLVLTAPTDVKVLSFSPDQMNLRELRRIPEERVSAVLGVSAGVVGLGAGLDRNTFTNYGEARAAGYEETIIPKQRVAAAELEVQLLDEFVNLDDGWDVDFDTSNVKALAGYVDATWKRFQSAASVGLVTRAAFKRATNQAVDPGGADEVYILPNNYVVLDAQDASVVAGGSKPPAAIPARTTPPASGNGRSASAIDIPGTEIVAIAPNREVLAEARCPGCNKLLGLDVVGARFVCPRCKQESAFGEAAA